MECPTKFNINHQPQAWNQRLGLDVANLMAAK
jgi:hypothetical protein